MKTALKITPKAAIKNGKRKAFALVLALALMGFMVLLITTLATMVQMQMRLSRQTLNQQKARQAAKFAAFQAMSHVQSALGPDQRITANAMMFDDSVSNQIEKLEKSSDYDWWSSPMYIDREEVNTIDDPALSQNRFWVGVWDSRRGHSPEKQKRTTMRQEYVTKTVEKALTWLVSGNQIRPIDSTDYSLIHYKPTTKLEDGKYVRAVASGSYSDEYGTARPENDVMAPLLTLDKDPDPITGEVRSDGKETRIAWWVGDEGQKASLNAVASHKEMNFADQIEFRKQSLPYYSGIHGLTVPNMGGKAGSKAFDIDMQDTDDDTCSLARIRNLTDVKQLDVLKAASIPNTIELSKLFFHSATFDTKGLLVNVRDGGLKKDLSLGLTRKNFDNEDEDVGDNENSNAPEYFERPYGVSGYDFKTTAFPLVKGTMVSKYHIDPTKSGESDRILNGNGHIFGPQMYGHEIIADAENMSAVKYTEDMVSDKYLWKDPGGPLWDQLRSYYNLRTKDSSKDSNLTTRVQTDDRIGLKPVVKRFQVFYVPSFVNYGGQKWGLRLHIIPLLILYNPYDMKIKGETYYAMYLYGQFNHNVGQFRFAIGYQSGQYFQCLRDLRTELMPSLSYKVFNTDGSIANDLRLRQFWLPVRFYANWDYSENQYANNQYPFISAKGNYESATSWIASRYTRTYFGFKDNKNRQLCAFPLGYGSVSPSEFRVPSGNNTRLHFRGIVSGSGGFSYQSGIENNFVDKGATVMPLSTGSNVVPQFIESYDRMNDGNYNTARVARIPLFLNALTMSVDHGQYSSSMKKSRNDSDSFLFAAQRPIDAYRPENCSKIKEGSSANLSFLAYDSKGIEPGQAKIFSMRNIVNYIGDFSTSGNVNRNGPNGDLEGDGKTSGYDRHNAMMHGLDDGGKFGGCFYIDIPHPETEHAAKFDNDYGWQYNTDYEKYVLFDLDLMSQYRNYLKDRHNTYPPTSINDIYVDMQDVAGWGSRSDSFYGTAGFPLAAKRNTTPCGYGFGSYRLNYGNGTRNNITMPAAGQDGFWSILHPNPYQYINVYLNVWIWKREGMNFANFGNNTNYGWENRGELMYITGPTLTFARGVRLFMYKKPSFPDPTLDYTSSRGVSGKFADANVAANYNFHIPGQTAGTGGARICSLRAYNYYSNPTSSNESGGNTEYIDSVMYDKGLRIDNRSTELIYYKGLVAGDSPAPEDIAKEYVRLNEFSTSNTIYPNARYYYNWLAFNPRRHSANYWAFFDNYDLNKGKTPSLPSYSREQMYERILEDSSQYFKLLGDGVPQALRGLNMYKVQNHNSFNYAAQLHSAINNTAGAIPYGIVFSQPYADNSAGSQPYYNRRLFVNNNNQYMSLQPDYCGVNGSDNNYNWLGRVAKSFQGFDSCYGTEGVAFTNVGYNVESPDGLGVRTGLKPNYGTLQSPMHHILRKTEVVSNPANLASANLTFGSGNFFTNVYAQNPNKSLNDQGTYQRSFSISQPDELQPSVAIGNSLCPNRISPERAYQIRWLDGSTNFFDVWDGGGYDHDSFDGKRDTTWNGDRNVLYDYSWQLNDALWDEYYFSTLPYRKDEAEKTLDPSIAYPQNPRLQYVSNKQDDMLTIQDLTSNSNETQFDENASKMWINGAFNVNSTSIDAWKAILSTYYGTDVNDYNGSRTTLEESAPFVRWAAPYKAEAFTSASSATEEDLAFQGFRALDDTEIEELACSIVEHIKDRGPFYSMSHFVNRVVADMSAEQRFTDNYVGEKVTELPEALSDRKNLTKEYEDEITYRIDHSQKGILQAAIDSTSINSPFHSDEDTVISISNERNMADALKGDENYAKYRSPKQIWENWRGAIGPQATGAPAYLMQQDLLSKLGSFLTVRSDTFKIRAYGEVRNPVSGAVEGKAWCEMVVQRLPEYMDTESPNQEAWRINGREYEIGYQGKVNSGKDFNSYIEELSDVNKYLGRRFKVVSFKWLNGREI